jgi:hypothetical protein
LAGITKGCGMNVYMRKTVKDVTKKSNVAAELSVAYNSAASPGGGISASYGRDKSSSDSEDNMDISIKYDGANSDAFIQSTSLADL